MARFAEVTLAIVVVLLVGHTAPAAEEASEEAPGEIVLEFDGDESGLDAGDRSSLDALVSRLDAKPELLVEVGRRDWTRARLEQKDLIHARATAVRSHLVEAGVAPARVLLPLDERTSTEREMPLVQVRLVTIAADEQVDKKQEGDDELELDTPPIKEVTRYVYVTTVEEVERRPFNFGVGGSAGLVGSLDGATGFGGAWNVRLTAGTRHRIAAEVAYLGTAQPMDAEMGLGNRALLMSHGGEGAMRIALLDSAVQPYGFAGVGFSRFYVAEATQPVDGDSVVFTPVGAGLSYRADSLLFDLRGTVRAAYDDDMFAEHVREAELDHWSVGLMVGAEL